MTNVGRRRSSWELSERAATDEVVFRERRRFLAALGFGGAAAGLAAFGGRAAQDALLARGLPEREALVAARSKTWSDAGREVTSEDLVLRYNNFYEFTTDKRRVWKLARDFRLAPYELLLDGLVAEPRVIDLGDVEALGLEERVYRFRCVEAWAMTVPWTGVPLAKLVALAAPTAEARYVALGSFDDPARAPGQRAGTYPFPYYEALSLEEAAHPLAFVATGAYGKRLAPQSGAPLRVVLPWKYGYKGPKSVVRLTFTAERPPTFWNDLQPDEYSWLSNVDPAVPHPRWSQASERVLGTGERVPTLPFNGYAREVAALYA